MQAVCSSRNAALLQLTLRIVRKLLWMLLVLWGITLISFWVIPHRYGNDPQSSGR